MKVISSTNSGNTNLSYLTSHVFLTFSWDEQSHKISMFRYSFVGAIYNNLILNGIIFSAENAFTLAECLSVTLSLTQSPISMRLLMLLLIFTASHCPLNVTSGLPWLWNGLNNDKCGLFSSNYHKHNNSFVQISFFVYSYILSWLILR